MKIRLTLSGLALLATSLLLLSANRPTPPPASPLAPLLTTFAEGYPQHSQGVALAFQDNLPSGDRSAEAYRADLRFFTDLLAALESLPVDELSAADRLEYGIVMYECQLQQERLQLTLAAQASPAAPVEGLHQHPQGAAWYAYMVKAWTSTPLSPDSIRALGYRLAHYYRGQLLALHQTPNLAPAEERWFTDRQADIETTYQQVHQTVLARLPDLFPDFATLPTISFSPVASPRMQQVPGYYTNNTLYYNTFRTTYDLRQADWLYIHEANPGHHFQIQYESQVTVPQYREALGWGGFREGWAAYVEDRDLGQALGLYQTPEALASMYQWNLIRAVRLILDVELNLGRLTDAQALALWNQYLPNMEAVGQREIDRMRRWPAQVLTYMVGAEAIRQLKAQQQEALGSQFSLKTFHTQVLSQRSIPVVCLPLLFEPA